MSAAGKFKDCFKEISKMIQESFVEFFFFWHSSQLPEQKGGFFLQYRGVYL